MTFATSAQEESAASHANEESTELRQSDVAEILRKPQPFVSRYERVPRRLDLVEREELCRILGISLRKFGRDLKKSGARGKRAI
jgi:hypothetical protein